MKPVESRLVLRLTGPFACHWSDGTTVLVKGTKQRALLAMLAVATNGTHSRTLLRDVLWSRVEKEQAADSLRQALAALRKAFGRHNERLLSVDRQNIRLNHDYVDMVFDDNSLTLLEGLDIAEPKFDAWLAGARKTIIARREPALPTQFQKLRPKLSVVPFLARHNHDEEHHLGDLIAQEVLRALSRNSVFDVVNHYSSRRFSGPQMDLANLHNSLDIDYMATGTLSIKDERFRLDVDFIQVKGGRIVWTQMMEGKVADLLVHGSPLLSTLAYRIGSGVMNASVELARTKPLPQVESHALFMSALAHMNEYRLRTFSKSRHILEQLIERHPQEGALNAWLGMWYLLRQAQGMGGSGRDDLKDARQATDRALEIDAHCPTSLTINGMTLSHDARDFSAATKRFDAAIAEDPNHALAHLMHSRLCSFTGQGDNAVELAERASTLSPRDPQLYLFEVMRAAAYLVKGDYATACTIAERSLRANPRHYSSLRCLIVARQLAGDEEGARRAMEQLRKREPDLTVSSYLRTHPAGDMPTGQLWAQALSAAGLPQ